MVCAEVHRKPVWGFRKFVLVVCMGSPTQHTGLPGWGLPGWEPCFHGNPRASGSGPGAENRGNLLPGKGQKKLPLGFSLLRGCLPISALGGLQTKGAGPCTPGRELLSVEDETQVFPTTAWGRQLIL